MWFSSCRLFFFFAVQYCAVLEYYCLLLLLMDVWVVSGLGLLEIKLPYFFGGHKCSFLELWNCWVQGTHVFSLVGTAEHFHRAQFLHFHSVYIPTSSTRGF